jgi:Plasmid recombination enzyme
MASSHIIRLGKIKGDLGVSIALKHNKRTLQIKHGVSANIDATRTPLNYSLVNSDSPEAIAIHAKIEMLKVGINRPRKNGVMAVEVLFSLPIDRHKQDTRPFFSDCFNWVKHNFAGELLSFDVHLDESAPHAHAIILPLIDGRMQGNHMVGNTGNLMRLINKFHLEVARHYGMSKNGKSQLTSLDKKALERLVLAHLKGDPVMKSCVWSCIRDAIHNDPLPYAQMLSIPLRVPTAVITKVSAPMMTAKSKGKSTIAIYSV